MLAWKAIVGLSFDSALTHPEVTRGGTRSHLLSKDQMFVWGLLPYVLLNGPTTSPLGISGIQNRQKHVRTIDHLEQLSPNASALSFLETGLEGGVLALFFLGKDFLFRKLVIFFGDGRQHGLERIHGQPWFLSLRILSKGLCKWLCLQQSHSALLAILAIEKGHGQFVLVEQDLVGIARLGRHFLAKLDQLLLANDSRVAKPSTVRLDARHCRGRHR